MANPNRKVVDLREVEEQIRHLQKQLDEVYGRARDAVRSGLYYAELSSSAVFSRKGRLEKDIDRMIASLKELPRYPFGDKPDKWPEPERLEENAKIFMKLWGRELSHSSAKVWSLVVNSLINGRLYSEKDKFADHPEKPKGLSASETHLWKKENADYLAWKEWREKLTQWFKVTGHEWPKVLTVIPEPVSITISADAMVSNTAIEGIGKINNYFIVPPMFRPELVGCEYNQPRTDDSYRGSSIAWFLCRTRMELSEGWHNPRPIDLFDDLIAVDRHEDRSGNFFRKITGAKIRDRLAKASLFAVYHLLTYTLELPDEVIHHSPVEFRKGLGEGNFSELKAVLSKYSIEFVDKPDKKNGGDFKMVETIDGRHADIVDRVKKRIAKLSDI